MDPVATVCPFCACGCGLYLRAERHPVSQGRLCKRGWNTTEAVSSPQRLRSPLLRHRATGELRVVAWEEALDRAAEGLGQIGQSSGPAAVGVLGSARATNEENYLLGKLARGGLGTNSLDSTARLPFAPGFYGLLAATG